MGIGHRGKKGSEQMKSSWRQLGWVALWCISAMSLRAEPVNLDNPQELHRMLAREKADRLESARAAWGSQPASISQLNYDALYYDLNITLNIASQSLSG